MSRPAGRRRLGLTREQIQDFLFYALIGVLVGGRTFFVINDIISKHDAFVLSRQSDQFHRGLERRHGVSRRPGRRDRRDLRSSLRKHPGLQLRVARRRGRDDAADRHHARAAGELHQRRTVGRRLQPRPPVVHAFPKAPIVDGTSYRHPSQLYEAMLDILTLPMLLIRLSAQAEGRRGRRGRGSRSTASRAASPSCGARPTSRGWASPAASSTRCR